MSFAVPLSGEAKDVRVRDDGKQAERLSAVGCPAQSRTCGIAGSSPHPLFSS